MSCVARRKNKEPMNSCVAGQQDKNRNMARDDAGKANPLILSHLDVLSKGSKVLKTMAIWKVLKPLF